MPCTHGITREEAICNGEQVIEMYLEAWLAEYDRSQVFPGLWLAVNDLLSGNMGRVLAVLQEGLAAPEHTVFVQQRSK